MSRPFTGVSIKKPWGTRENYDVVPAKKFGSTAASLHKEQTRTEKNAAIATQRSDAPIIGSKTRLFTSLRNILIWVFLWLFRAR